MEALTVLRYHYFNFAFDFAFAFAFASRNYAEKGTLRVYYLLSPVALCN